MEGFIYVLSNDWMPGIYKIGYTESAVEKRAKQLFTTGVPVPFKIEASYEIDFSRFNNIKSVEDAEKWIHSIFEDERVHASREFFKVSPKKVKTILSQFTKKDNTLEVTEAYEADPENQKEEEQVKIKRRPNTSFSKIGLNKDDIIYLVKNKDIRAKIVDDRTIIEIDKDNNEISDKTALTTLTQKIYKRDYNKIVRHGSTFWQTENGDKLSMLMDDLASRENETYMDDSN